MGYLRVTGQKHVFRGDLFKESIFEPTTMHHCTKRRTKNLESVATSRIEKIETETESGLKIDRRTGVDEKNARTSSK